MSAAAAQTVNLNADVLKKGDASNMNINAARGLQDVLKSNLGPKGTLKMLVSGAGDIKLTKDGHTLLYEMQIQNPTANMIARVATAPPTQHADGIGVTLYEADGNLRPLDAIEADLLSDAKCKGFQDSDRRMIEMACSQTALSAVKQHKSGSLDLEGLRAVQAQVTRIRDAAQAVKVVGAADTGAMWLDMAASSTAACASSSSCSPPPVLWLSTKAV